MTLLGDHQNCSLGVGMTNTLLEGNIDAPHILSAFAPRIGFGV